MPSTIPGASASQYRFVLTVWWMTPALIRPICGRSRGSHPPCFCFAPHSRRVMKFGSWVDAEAAGTAGERDHGGVDRRPQVVEQAAGEGGVALDVDVVELAA